MVLIRKKYNENEREQTIVKEIRKRQDRTRKTEGTRNEKKIIKIKEF